MRYKTLYLILCLLFVSISASTARADTYTITDPYTGSPSFNGGPFLINGSMLTFCLEITEYFNPGGTYYGTINPYADAGGITPTPGHDDLNPSTAWLYNEFLNNPNAYGVNERIALQLAIWRLEDEFGINSMNYGTYESSLGSSAPAIISLADSYYTQSSGHSDQSILNVVQVLNLYGNPNLTDKKQSQLIRVPEPNTLLLLGAGLLGVGLLGRKKFRRKD